MKRYQVTAGNMPVVPVPDGRATAAHCVGASIPRSGHSFLRRILMDYFGTAMVFCVPRQGGGCCGRMPCVGAHGKAFWYQKNHDHDLDIDNTATQPWLFYLVQDRHPLPQMLSHIEQREDAGVPFRPDHHIHWLARQLVFRRCFTRKWILPPRPDVLLLRYEDLAADPTEHVGALLRTMIGSLDVARLQRAVARVSPFRNGTERYRPRDIQASRHFDPALHGAFEAIALAECAAGPYAPILGHGPVPEDHPLMLAYRAQLAALP
jgi:hypothetical protein